VTTTTACLGRTLNWRCVTAFFDCTTPIIHRCCDPHTAGGRVGTASPSWQTNADCWPARRAAAPFVDYASRTLVRRDSRHACSRVDEREPPPSRANVDRRLRDVRAGQTRLGTLRPVMLAANADDHTSAVFLVRDEQARGGPRTFDVRQRRRRASSWPENASGLGAGSAHSSQLGSSAQRGWGDARASLPRKALSAQRINSPGAL
jgi:hypothetical protein